MWIILVGDNDVDYTSAYGPFPTRKDGEAALRAIYAQAHYDESTGENMARLTELKAFDLTGMSDDYGWT